MNYQLLINSQALDLPRDMQLSWQRQSPFFSKEGSFSLPLTLPDTDRNRRLLGFCNRPDAVAEQQTNRFTAIFISGALQQQVTLCVLSYTPEQGFEVSMLLNESSIWDRLRDVTLKQVLQTRYYDPPVRTALRSAGGIGTTTPDDTIEALDERARRTEKDQAGVLISEIRTRLFTDSLDALHDDFEVATVITPRGVINEPIPPVDPDMSPDPYHLMLIDGEKVLGPEGIGHSVFLHLDYVLRAVFDYIGRELTIEFPESEQEGEPSLETALRRTMILNQTIDALVPGRIYFDTLVPEVPCLELLQAMFALYGAGFVEQPDGSVRMVFLEQVLSTTGTRSQEQGTRTLNFSQLSTLNSQLQTINYKAPAALEIQPGHIRHEDDAELETPEQLSKYGNISSDGIKQFDIFGSDERGAIMNDDVEDGDLGVNPETDNLCVARKEEDDIMHSSLVCPNQTGFLHPVRGTTQTDYESEQIEAPFSDTHPADTHRLLPTLQRYGELLRCKTALMPGLRNETCTVEQTVTKEDQDGTTTTETQNITQSDDCPLSFAYYTGRMFYAGTADPAVLLPQYWYLREDEASPRTYIRNVCPELALHMTGTGQMMHRSYNKALQAGAHEVTFTAWMTRHELHSFDFCRTYVINGSRYLPLQLQTQNSESDLQQATITMMKLP